MYRNLLLLIALTASVAQAQDAVVSLASLNGANGFRIDGANLGDNSGRSVSVVGDVNADGVDDLVIGATGFDVGGLSTGAAYVVFGKRTAFDPTINLASLDGSNGFRLEGEANFEQAGRSVSAAGDVNGDGIDDIAIGSDNADSAFGRIYIVFGRSTAFDAVLPLNALNGSNGFRISGALQGGRTGGMVRCAGDVNGDGVDDLIFGAAQARIVGIFSGSAYVMFGKRTPFSAIESVTTLDGSNGFRLDGNALGDGAGISVDGAGDLNRDGFDDVVIGAYNTDLGVAMNSGSAFVVFGKSTPYPAVAFLSSLNGSNGFRIDGPDGFDSTGNSVSGVGDINSDGFDDLLIGAPGADPGGIFGAGRSYIVFGKATPFAARFSLFNLTAEQGFYVDGVSDSDRSGTSLSAVGDVNADGINDFLIGAEAADPNGNNFSGSSYLVFGRNVAFPFVLPLASLDGQNGVRFDGVSANEAAGNSVSGGGDINGDGITDFLIAAASAGPAGSTYVVFGKTELFSNGFEN